MRLYVFCMEIQVDDPGELVSAANKTPAGIKDPVAEKKRYMEGHIRDALMRILGPDSSSQFIPGCTIRDSTVKRLD